ncbi:MAG: hypothetical protein ACE367_06560 [Acidimicrobiales bacterium]
MGATGVPNLRHALAVLAVATIGITACGEAERPGPSPSTAEPTPTAVPPWAGEAAVSIERFDQDVFSSASGPSEWTLDGPWRVESADGAAAVDSGDDGPAVALIDLGGPYGLFQATFPVTADGAGLTFRHIGPANHWAIVGAPSFGTWNLIRVVNGTEEFVTNLGSVDAGDGAIVGIVLDDESFSVTIDGEVVHTQADVGDPRATRVGLWSEGPSARSARWDDVVSIRAAQLEQPDGPTG